MITDGKPGDKVKYDSYGYSVRDNQTGIIRFCHNDGSYTVFFPKLEYSFRCSPWYLFPPSEDEIEKMNRIEHAMKYL